MDETVKIYPSKQTTFNFELQSFKFTDYDQVTKLTMVSSSLPTEKAILTQVFLTPLNPTPRTGLHHLLHHPV